jgi:hypothetical protein
MRRQTRRRMRGGFGEKGEEDLRYIDNNLFDINTIIRQLEYIFNGKDSNFFQKYNMVGIRNKTKNLCNELKKIKEMIKENPLYEKLKEEHGNV